jgi:integrase
MGTIYARGRKLWMSYRDETGKRQWKSTGFEVGQENDAERLLEQIEAMVAAGGLVAGDEVGPVTLQRYGDHWLKEREADGLATFKDERTRLRLHVYPELGRMALGEIRPRHVRELIRTLRRKKSAKGEPLAPKSVHNIYGVLHRLLQDAVVDELIDANPCVLKKGDLPPKIDKDPTWRDTAVFARAEVETVISSEIIPWDRRVCYALLFLASVRFGEAAALQWRDWSTEAEPLGRLAVVKSYNTKKRTVTEVKTKRPRGMPVHPALAAILAEWKLAGWPEMIGRAAEPDDLVIPSRSGNHRNANHMLRRFHQDLERVGLRSRRQHDLRRTFISLARADGARTDILKWVTHGPPKAVIDDYTTLPWATLCGEVAKLRIERRTEAQVSSLQDFAAQRAAGADAVTLGVTVDSRHPGQTQKSQESRGLLASADWRGGRDSNPRPPA